MKLHPFIAPLITCAILCACILGSAKFCVNKQLQLINERDALQSQVNRLEHRLKTYFTIVVPTNTFEATRDANPIRISRLDSGNWLQVLPN